MTISNKLYIPKTITVGFQKRSGTFTGMLAYVIYTDHKGKLRKEASWNSWRDKKITELTFDNTPNQGFTLNKGVQRYGYWGSGRSVVRVWDPRNFEFEISVDNLMGILMHSDVSKRDIVDSCVYAWNGAELVLLPTSSQEYQESVTYTEKQAVKFSAKDLKVGATYDGKKNNQYVYLGYFEQYQYVGGDKILKTTDRYKTLRRDDRIVKSVSRGKKHVFYELETDETWGDPLSYAVPTTIIAGLASEDMHPDFAKFLDEYYCCFESQPAIKLELRPFSSEKNYQKLIWVETAENTFACVEVIHESYRGIPRIQIRHKLVTAQDPLMTFSESNEFTALQAEFDAVFKKWYLEQSATTHYVDISSSFNNIFKDMPYKLGENFLVVLADGKTCSAPTIY